MSSQNVLKYRLVLLKMTKHVAFAAITSVSQKIYLIVCMVVDVRSIQTVLNGVSNTTKRTVNHSNVHFVVRTGDLRDLIL